MSLLPPGNPGNLIGALLRIVQSPRAHQGLGQLKRFLPYASGPLSNSRGSSPRFGQWHDPSQETVGTWHTPQSDAAGNALGTVLGIGGALGQYMQQQNDPMTQLYAQLLDQLQQPVNAPTGINTDDLMSQVKAALNPIYDQRASTAKSQNARAQTDIKGMYQALADDYKKVAPQQAAQAKQAQQDVSQIYGQLRSNIEGSYGRVAQEQGDLFKQLGIEAAAPDVLNPQGEIATAATTAASENQAQQQQRYEDIGNMDQTYYQEGSPQAIMAGNEYATNLLNKLQDYLNQNESERASGIQTAYMDQLGQAQNNLLQQQQMANSETNRRQEMLWQMLQSQMQGSQKQQALTPDTYMSQLSPQMQQSVGSAFTQLERSPNAIYGKTEDPRNPVPGTFVDTTPQWYMAQADQMYQNGQIDEATHQALLMYMQLYFGMGK